ncbi:hypothetical protein AAF712_007666 [Marasmius tenuissimus]|uniref:Uncharacterized protein n=1 Tax=Marasmius tenuissimus TaxID=585030 RepID=A0ABR2ZW63_9AGAR|nr:hypothetical protein PM082_024681 [Marasmius tenuissimus]
MELDPLDATEFGYLRTFDHLFGESGHELTFEASLFAERSVEPEGLVELGEDLRRVDLVFTGLRLTSAGDDEGTSEIHKGEIPLPSFSSSGKDEGRVAVKHATGLDRPCRRAALSRSLQRYPGRGVDGGFIDTL